MSSLSSISFSSSSSSLSSCQDVLVFNIIFLTRRLLSTPNHHHCLPQLANLRLLPIFALVSAFNLVSVLLLTFLLILILVLVFNNNTFVILMSLYPTFCLNSYSTLCLHLSLSLSSARDCSKQSRLKANNINIFQLSFSECTKRDRRWCLEKNSKGKFFHPRKAVFGIFRQCILFLLVFERSLASLCCEQIHHWSSKVSWVQNSCRPQIFVWNWQNK